MKITNLPQDIRERAEANARSPKCKGVLHAFDVDENDTVLNSFVWEYSPEGWGFWILVYQFKFDEARALLNG